MPDMIDPAGEVTRVDDIIVTAAYQNFFVFATDGGDEGPLPGGDDEIEPLEEPIDPDDFMPEPQNCADVAYMLQEYERKREGHDNVRDFLEGFDIVAQVKDILEEILVTTAVDRIASVSQRYVIIRDAVVAASSRLAARVGVGGLAGGLLTFILYLTTRATLGRWDARIASLQETGRQWNCPGHG